MILHGDDHFDCAQVNLRVLHVECRSPPGRPVVPDVLHLTIDQTNVPVVVLVPRDLVRLR